MSDAKLPTHRHVEVIRAKDLPRIRDVTPLLWVIVYGPGSGEAVVVRLPDGRVGVVDGCREPGGDAGSGDKNPIANLLRELQPARLMFACLTHPHEDHYRGLGHLLDRDFKGRVDHVWNVLSLTAHENDAVLGWIRRHYDQEKGDEQPDEERVRGLERAMSSLLNAARHASSPARRQQLLAGRRLLREEVCAHRFEIEAWGPSDEDADDALFEFLYSTDKGIDGAALDPNTVSGALLIRWKEARILLAGDLLRHSHPHRGWASARRLLERHGTVQVVNVAHHASEEAHDEVLWGQMRPRLAVVTPFRNAEIKKGEPLHPPRPRDVQRLLDSKCSVAITTEPQWHRDARTGYPRRLNAGRVPSPSKPKPVLASSKIKASAAAPPNARDNAVAVALAPNGDIVEVVLAGDADFYR